MDQTAFKDLQKEMCSRLKDMEEKVKMPEQNRTISVNLNSYQQVSKSKKGVSKRAYTVIENNFAQFDKSIGYHFIRQTLN